MRLRFFLALLIFPLLVQAAGPIGLSVSQNLNFGTLVINTGTTGTITINPNGSVSGLSGITVIGNTQHNAVVNITGDANTNVSIILTPNAITGTSMTITSATASPSSCTLDASGQCTVQIGASLQVGGGQAAGNFPTSITMTVDYI